MIRYLLMIDDAEFADGGFSIKGPSPVHVQILQLPTHDSHRGGK